MYGKVQVGKDQEKGDFLGPPYGTTPAAVIAIKTKLRSFKNSEHINEKGGGPYRGFVYSSLFSDPIDLATWGQRELLYFAPFIQRLVKSKWGKIDIKHVTHVQPILTL